MGVGQKDVIKGAGAQYLFDVFRDRGSGKGEAGIIEDGGLAVIQQKRAVPRDGPDIRDGDFFHILRCSFRGAIEILHFLPYFNACR